MYRLCYHVVFSEEGTNKLDDTIIAFGDMLLLCLSPLVQKLNPTIILSLRHLKMQTNQEMVKAFRWRWYFLFVSAQSGLEVADIVMVLCCLFFTDYRRERV